LFKLFASVMAAGIAVAACGGNPPPAVSSAPSSAAAATAALGQLPTPELTKVRIGISTPTEPVQFAETLAERLGIYKKYGITTVEVTGFEGDGKALQALIADQVDFFVGGASTAINSVITDTPVKVISMNSTTLTDGLFCGAAIKVPADVKGKSVAVSTFGGTSHGSALLMLKGIGLTDKDAVITQTGGEGVRIAALKGGSVGCAVVGMSQEKAMKDLGMNLLIDLSKAKLQWGRSGLMAKTSFLAKNPNTALVVVAAALEAQNSIWSDTKTATDKFVEWAQVKPDAATNVMTDFLTYGSRSMTFTADAFTAPRDVLASVNPAVKDVDVTKAFDLSYLTKLKDIGFYQKNSIPTTN
jgi:ABC-type nitrate/sulfonate/bicarbonate transport system substrate-binding protein